MRGIKVDDNLLANAESNLEETLASLDDRAQAYADQFHSQVIVPFCNQHNLRFWSGNGVWFFEAPGGRTFDDPEVEIMRWAQATGNAEFKEDSRYMEGQRWVVTCGKDDLPEFFYNFSEINRMLLLSFMGECLGFWINDHRPSTFPLQEREK